MRKPQIYKCKMKKWSENVKQDIIPWCHFLCFYITWDFSLPFPVLHIDFQPWLSVGVSFFWPDPDKIPLPTCQSLLCSESLLGNRDSIKGSFRNNGLIFDQYPFFCIFYNLLFYIFRLDLGFLNLFLTYGFFSLIISDLLVSSVVPPWLKRMISRAPLQSWAGCNGLFYRRRHWLPLDLSYDGLIHYSRYLPDVRLV
jgi:hypothetical protein